MIWKKIKLECATQIAAYNCQTREKKQFVMGRKQQSVQCINTKNV